MFPTASADAERRSGRACASTKRRRGRCWRRHVTRRGRVPDVGSSSARRPTSDVRSAAQRCKRCVFPHVVDSIRAAERAGEAEAVLRGCSERKVRLSEGGAGGAPHPVRANGCREERCGCHAALAPARAPSVRCGAPDASKRRLRRSLMRAYGSAQRAVLALCDVRAWLAGACEASRV